MAIYEKPVHELLREMVSDMSLAKGQIVTRQQVVAWFKERYPKVKQGTVTSHLIRMSTNAPSRVHYGVKPGDDDVFFQMNSGQYCLYDAGVHPPPLRKGEAGGRRRPDPDPDPDDGNDNCGGSEFAYEHDLRDYLARNLNVIEPGLRLYEDEDDGSVTGIEFPAGGRFIDILAVDRAGNYVVIELKVSRGYDRVVGQLLRYLTWIEKNHTDPGQTVRGVIVAREISEDLRLACCHLRNVRLFEYALSVTLKPIAS